MERPAKSRKIEGFARAIVAGNLWALVKKHYSSEGNLTKMQRKLAAESGVAFSTIQRLMKQEVGANLETLEALATPFDLMTYQLLIPKLDVGNPQVVKGASRDEQALYARWRKAKMNPAAPLQGTERQPTR